MIIFIPIAILLLFGIGIQVLGRTRFNIVQSWIFAIIGSVLAWFSFFIVKIIDNDQSVISFFPSESSINFQIIFQVGDKNWIFGCLLLTLLIVILLMDAKWLTKKNNLISWSVALLIGASGLLAIMTGSVIAFLLTSALLDIELFASQIIIHKESLEVRKTIFDFLLRIIGSFLIMFGLGLNGNVNLLLFSVGLGLRFGVVPSVTENSRTPPIKTNLTILFDMVVPISCFAFMNQIEVPNGEFQGKPIILIILIFCIFSNTLKIVANQWSQNGVRAWISAFSGLAILILINGQLEYIQPLAIVFCVLGGLLALELYGSSRVKIAIILLMLSMIGLPYTASYGIWFNTIQESSHFFLIFYHILLAFLILLVFQSIISMPAKSDQQDSWIKITSTISPVILLMVPWVFGIWSSSIKSDDLNLISPGIFLAILTLFIYFARSEKMKITIKKYFNSNRRVLNFITFGFSKLLSLAWVSRIVIIVNTSLSKIINVFIRVLEGDGGLLWAFVFLILVSSILLTYRIFS